MNPVNRKESGGYFWAVVAVIVATGLRWALYPYVKDAHVFMYYVLAVAFAVWAGGQRAGILATVLGAMAAAVVLAPGFQANIVGDVAGISIFAISCFVIIGLLQAQRKSAEQAMVNQLAEEASRARRAELEKKDRVALDNTWDVAIIVTDRNRIIREWNVGAAQITGWSRGEVIGQSTDILHLAPDLENGVPRRTILAAESMSKAPVARWLKGKDGEKFFAEGMVRPIVDQGGWINGFIEVFIDGTSRVQRQETLERQMLDRADQLESLSYSMAHDMRQYLRGIANNATLLARDLEGTISAEQGTAINRLAENAKRMHAMVEGILDHLRVRRAPLNSKPVDLSKLGEEVAESVQPSGSQPVVHFIVQPGMWVKGDADLLQTVITNLFENAHKYATGHVRFGFDPVRQAYYVKDEGPGFDPEYADKIFKPFFRLHGQEKPGTGIGLPNALGIVERHGGKMWAESEGDGKGATFFFTLKSFEEAPVGALI